MIRTDPNTADNPYNRMSVEAAEWFTTMQGPDVSSTDRMRFTEWLTQSADHVNEYLEIATMWRDLARTQIDRDTIDRLVVEARLASAAGNVIMLDANQSLIPRPRASAGFRQNMSRRRLLIAASLAFLAVAAVFGGLALDRSLNGRPYETGVGEQIAFSLDDGSVVRLNTQSRLRVRMTPTARSVELVRGEALFEVAKDSQRPFRVRVGSTVVQAVGTVFNVYRREKDDEATVTVIEGRVVVASASRVPNTQPQSAAADPTLSRSPSKRTRLELGVREQAHVSADGGIVATSDVSLDQVTAWKDRRLVFIGASLEEIAEEFNRYNGAPIRIEDPELARIRISAVFGATDPDSLIEFLERTESVSVRYGSGGARELYRKPPVAN